MSKSDAIVKVISHGIYSGWHAGQDTLPEIVKVCDEVPARIDIEFGMIVNIRKARGENIDWMIEHPGIRDDAGKRRAPFRGTTRVKSANWNFFLGDTIWAPIDDKMGIWDLSIRLHGRIIARKEIQIVPERWDRLF
jgi:hypothetical protein